MGIKRFSVFAMLSLVATTPTVNAGNFGEVGDGDYRLLAVVDQQNWGVVQLVKYAGSQIEWDGQSVDDSFIELCSPAQPWSTPSIGSRDLHVYRCFPLGNGDGFVRLSDGPVSWENGVFRQSTRIQRISLRNGHIVSTTVNEGELKKVFGFEGDYIFLGCIDDRGFFWNPKTPLYIFSRLRGGSGPVDRKIDGLTVACGILRGQGTSYLVAGWHKASHLFSTEPNEYALLKVSLSDFGEFHGPTESR